MKKVIAILVFVWAFCGALRAKMVEGQVRCVGRVISGVIVTDGDVFTRTGGEGTFRMEVRDDTKYIYVVPPYGFTVPMTDFYPQYWQEADGRTWFSFELVPISPATDYTLFAISNLQISTPEQFEAFESDFIPDLSDIAIKYRIKGLTVAVVRTDSISKTYLPKVKKLLSKAKIQLHLTDDGPENKAFFVGKDLVIFGRGGGTASQDFVKKISTMLQEDTYVFYPESFVNKWENAPSGYKIYSREGGRVSLHYHSVNPVSYPDEHQARFTLYERTVQSLEKEAFSAICSGVTRLQADLQLSRDGKVILLQENYPKYPFAAVKMEVDAFIDRMDGFALDAGFPVPNYTFAINSGSGAGEGKVWPEYREFADRCLAVLLAKNLGERLIIESFDDRVLNYIHKKYPQVNLCYLVDTECGSYEDFMSLLDFTPYGIGLQSEMADQALIRQIREAGMNIVIWE